MFIALPASQLAVDLSWQIRRSLEQLSCGAEQAKIQQRTWALSAGTLGLTLLQGLCPRFFPRPNIHSVALLLCTHSSPLPCSVFSVEPVAALRPLLAVSSGHTELDEEFTGLADEQGLMTIAGFGSLLSETSARSTFPHLLNFRVAKVWL